MRLPCWDYSITEPNFFISNVSKNNSWIYIKFYANIEKILEKLRFKKKIFKKKSLTY